MTDRPIAVGDTVRVVANLPAKSDPVTGEWFYGPSYVGAKGIVVHVNNKPTIKRFKYRVELEHIGEVPFRSTEIERY